MNRIAEQEPYFLNFVDLYEEFSSLLLEEGELWIYSGIWGVVERSKHSPLRTCYCCRQMAFPQCQRWNTVYGQWTNEIFILNWLFFGLVNAVYSFKHTDWILTSKCRGEWKWNILLAFCTCQFQSDISFGNICSQGQELNTRFPSSELYCTACKNLLKKKTHTHNCFAQARCDIKILYTVLAAIVCTFLFKKGLSTE